MTLPEIVERLGLTFDAIKNINQYLSEVDTAIVAGDATFDPFLTPERVAMLQALSAEIAEYRDACVAEMVAPTPKKAKKAK